MNASYTREKKWIPSCTIKYIYMFVEVDWLLGQLGYYLYMALHSPCPPADLGNQYSSLKR